MQQVAGTKRMMNVSTQALQTRPPPRVQRTMFQQPARIVQLPPIQRAPRPQQQQAVQQQQGALAVWADRYRRQVRSLPQGQAALHSLLHSVDHLLDKAQHCGCHSGVMKAYLQLGLVDLTSLAWQQRVPQLHAQQSRMPAELFKQQQLDAELALAGCRFMRLEAAQQLAKQLHLLLDDEGHCPSLNLGALPAPHALGLRVPQLLRDGLGLDLHDPIIRSSPQGPNSTSSLSNLSWDEYSTLSADQSMCGAWDFCYFTGEATWRPAPFGKFSTNELASLLTPDTVLASLPNGIWGRALVAAAQEQGLPVSLAQQQQQQQGAASAAQQQLGAVAGAAAAMPEAVKALLEESVGLQAAGSFSARVRQFSAAVAAVRSSLLGAPVPAPGAPGVQSN